MKNMHRFFTLLLFGLVSLSSMGTSTQVIILNDTVEKVYGINGITLSGDLALNRLNFEGSGEVISGEGVKVYLFGPVSDVLVSNLLLDGELKTVSFDKNGYFFIADNGPFGFTGSLEIRTIGQIRLFIQGPANKVSFRLKNGYSIAGDVYGVYGKEVIIQRSAKAPMLVDGSFHYVYAERDEFRYVINFKSFGSSLGNYVLDLPNGETVGSVQGAVKWEQQGSRLVLDLESEKASVIVDGFFSSTSLRIPLTEERHHVLIESDPEKKLSISTTAQEMDLKESSTSPRYANARAFLASGKDVFDIQVQKLGVLPSLAASVSRATNRIAVTQEGSIVGELNYQYSNTGVDYLEIDAPGTPLYAGTSSGPVKLTKDENLMLSLPKGQYQNLEYVYFTTRKPLNLIDMIDVPIAKTDLPITTAVTSVYLPGDYIVLETFGASGGSELPGADLFMVFFIVVGLTGYALKKDRKFVLCYVIFCLGLVYFNAVLLMLFIIVSLMLVVKRHIPKTRNTLGIIAGAVILVLALGALFVGMLMIWQLGVFSTGGGQNAVSYGSDYAEVESAAPAPMIKGMDLIGDDEEGAISVPVREGVLPVKLELPRMGKQITVTNYLVTKGKHPDLKILVISSYFKYLLYLLAAMFGIKAYRMYRRA